ncbi:dynein regulatory complex protein 9 [Coccinella septempunctata]|uniref:dynein regulatory complex protein 9 n=1 Tax=Coccinella septempunctata TaxID=41139 RepID=UPI001D06A049|nr:dynein regulatory complex protein 9 [Coccinella septempunctata]
MFFYQPPASEMSSEMESEGTVVDSRTIRFVERHTVIQERRRKTMKAPKKIIYDEPDDPELDEILSIGSMEIDPEMCQLSQLVAVTMASIMDDAAESCFIMGKTFGLPNVHIDMSHKTLQDRNELLRSHSTLFNPETLEDYSKTQNAYMIKKLHGDIIFLQTILAKGVKSLMTDYNYHPWLMCIDNYELELEQDSRLLDMVERKKQKLQQLKDKLHSDKIQCQLDCDKLSLAIGKARDEMEDFIIQSEIKRNYLENWEKSRRQQNNRLKTGREDIYQEKIRKAQTDSRKENRVHLEIGAYMAEYFKDIENSIQDWMNTYDKDIETKEEDILKMGFDIENLTNDLKSLNETYDKRQEEMNNWLERKAEKRRIEEELRFLNRMATRIQAWWRGTMVRKKLGPYRPASKKKNKKKKK